MPIANDYRPENVEDMVGQDHLLKDGKPIQKFIKNNFIPNMIFYGPSGTGKTTLARILAKNSNKLFIEINASTSSISDIKKAINTSSENGILLLIDEIQAFNKTQQKTLLEVIETGSVIMIALTADNPFFCIYKAIISRSILFEFKQISVKNIKSKITEVFYKILKEYDCVDKSNDLEESLNYIAFTANGDLRSAINNIEVLFWGGYDEMTKIWNADIEFTKDVVSTKIVYDKDGDNHYDLLSAFHKSLRGSDIDASIYYLAKLLSGESNLNDICRRLLCVASEDIGLINPYAIVITKACVDSALQLGMPEARLPLSQATLFLASQMKSNSTYLAIEKALTLIEKEDTGKIPDYLMDSHYQGSKVLHSEGSYKYPHEYPNNWVNQSYLPKEIQDYKFYESGNNNVEKNIENYWNNIKRN